MWCLIRTICFPNPMKSVVYIVFWMPDKKDYSIGVTCKVGRWAWQQAVRCIGRVSRSMT